MFVVIVLYSKHLPWQISHARHFLQLKMCCHDNFDNSLMVRWQFWLKNTANLNMHFAMSIFDHFLVLFHIHGDLITEKRSSFDKIPWPVLNMLLPWQFSLFFLTWKNCFIFLDHGKLYCTHHGNLFFKIHGNFFVLYNGKFNFWTMAN